MAMATNGPEWQTQKWHSSGNQASHSLVTEGRVELELEIGSAAASHVTGVDCRAADSFSELEQLQYSYNSKNRITRYIHVRYMFPDRASGQPAQTE